MDVVGILILILYILIDIYMLLLIFRFITEMVVGFSRSFNPPHLFAVIAEVVFRLTDPPVNLARRLVPAIRTGAMSLDLSPMVLFFVLGLIRHMIALIPIVSAG